jgi:anthranilate/para-aminobenzoate synthase component I
MMARKMPAGLLGLVLLSVGLSKHATAFSPIHFFHPSLGCIAPKNGVVPSQRRSVTDRGLLRRGVSSSAVGSTSAPEAETAEAALPNFNSVHVAKEGGMGVATASQQALEQGLSLGAPPKRPSGGTYLTKGGLQVSAEVIPIEFSTDVSASPAGTTAAVNSASAIEDLIDKLDHRKGCLLASTYEFPGRYARWSLGFVDPPLQVSGKGSHCTISALNSRGSILMPSVKEALEQLQRDGVLQSVSVTDSGNQIDAVVVPPPEVGTFSEEDRSRQPSLFSIVRALVDLFGYQGGDGQLGLYGAFGYDLTFQFEPIDLKQQRDPEQRDLLLYLPDDIIVVDQDKRDAWRVSYDFAAADQVSTLGVPRTGTSEAFQPYDESTAAFVARDTPKNDFAISVEKAKREFAVGNLFEAVLSQTFREKLDHGTPPSVLFRRLRSRNPAPYGFLINLGEQEYLVGASPEMFVRCEAIQENDYRPGALRVETCPISGTVARGADALEDAQRVKSLLMNAKEESELTMCTDVDRNDKSRICEPGSVQVIGRRQIEMYSRLIHSVDHVEGYVSDVCIRLRAGSCVRLFVVAPISHLLLRSRDTAWRCAAAARIRRPRCVPVPHVGRYGDRRAQNVGDPVRGGQRAVAPVLVRGRRRGGGLRRESQHGPHPPHGPGPQGRRRGPRRCDATVRLESGRRRIRNRAQGFGHDRCHCPEGSRGRGWDQGEETEAVVGGRERQIGHLDRSRGLIRPHAGELLAPNRCVCQDAPQRSLRAQRY